MAKKKVETKGFRVKVPKLNVRTGAGYEFPVAHVIDQTVGDIESVIIFGVLKDGWVKYSNGYACADFLEEVVEDVENVSEGN